MSDLVQMTFDYGLLSAETRIFVEEKTLAIQSRLKRTAEDIILIGKDLRAVQQKLRDENKTNEKQGNGQFLGWLKDEFEMSHMTAYRFMAVAETFGEKLNTVLSFSPKVLYELSASSEETKEVRKKVETGEIPPTLEDIKKAKEALRLAKIAEAKAKADAQAIKQQFLNLQGSTQTELDALTKQIEVLEQEIETITTPEVEIREVEKEVIPQSVTKKLQTLQQKLEQLTRERKQQEERIQKLNADLSVAVRKQMAAENDDRIRQNWRSIASETHACMMRLLAQWPTPLDTRAFESDDWAHVDHLQTMLKRVLGECGNLSYSEDDMIVEANGSPYALSTYDVAT